MASNSQDLKTTIPSSSAGKGSHHCDILTANPGNPIFSCDRRFTKYASTLVTEPKTREPASQKQHPMYMTTSNSYGSLQPTVETCPNSFHGRSQKFSEHLAHSGMYRNNSLNIAMDHSRV